MNEPPFMGLAFWNWPIDDRTWGWKGMIMLQSLSNVFPAVALHCWKVERMLQSLYNIVTSGTLLKGWECTSKFIQRCHFHWLVNSCWGWVALAESEASNRSQPCLPGATEGGRAGSRQGGSSSEGGKVALCLVGKFYSRWVVHTCRAL